MTLTAADYARTEPSYAWRCASCARLFATNRAPDPPLNHGPAAYLRNPISADETKEHALLCCADMANNSPELHEGFWTRPAPGALAMLLGRAPAPRRVYQEHRPLDLAFVFVARGDSEVWTAPMSRTSEHGYVGPSDASARINAYRLDVFIDEDRENRREYFTTLLAGLRLQPVAGEMDQGPRDGFVLERRASIRTDVFGGRIALAPDLDVDENEDVMFHAGVSPSVDLVIPPRQGFHVRLAYGLAPGLGGRPSPIPIGFMRVVVLGETTRDGD